VQVVDAQRNRPVDTELLDLVHEVVDEQRLEAGLGLEQRVGRAPLPHDQLAHLALRLVAIWAVSQGIEERGKGPRCAQLVTMAPEHDDASTVALGGAGVEDRRLPDAGLAFQEQHLPCTLTRLRAKSAEKCERRISPYEHRWIVLPI